MLALHHTPLTAIMCSTKNEQRAIPVQIVGRHGLVWNIPDILRLRQEYRIVGCMVGGITGYKTQVAVSGLPLKLSAEEVTLALQAGWVELYQTNFTVQTERTTDPQQLQLLLQLQQQRQLELQQRIEQKKQRQQLPDDIRLRDVEQYDEYYALYYNQPPPPPERQQQHDELQQQEQEQQQELEQQQQHAPLAPWQLAVTSSSLYEIPLTVQQRTQHEHIEQQQQQPNHPPPQQQQQQHDQHHTEQKGLHSSNNAAAAAAAGHVRKNESGIAAAAAAAAAAVLQPVKWVFPQTHQQQLRMAVFKDLHTCGYYLTNGAKFGGDFLAYPGDPSLYHAQFVVRVLPLHLNLNPVLLKGLARGVHSARKQLLLATVVEQQQQCGEAVKMQHSCGIPKQQQQQAADVEPATEQTAAAAAAVHGYCSTSEVLYITVAKEDGFGSNK